MNKEEQENREFEKLKELGIKLHVPIPETFLTLEVFDKDGNPVCPKCSSPVPKDRESCPDCGAKIKYHQASHSWVRNAYNLLFCSLAAKQTKDATFEAGKLSIKDTGGTIRQANVPYPHSPSDADAAGQGLRGAAGSVLNGIVVGTGIGAESFEDYGLGTLVASGSAATQMDYSEQKAHAITYTAGTKVLKSDFIRYFNNNSGGSIVISEVGLYLKGQVDGATARYWMQARDLLGATKTVADTGQLKVVYTIEITYPS